MKIEHLFVIKSLLGTKIGSLDIRSKVDLLNRLEDEVDKGDPPPDKHPNDEEVRLVEKAEEVHVPDLNLENLGTLCSTQVPSKQYVHQLDQSGHPQVHHHAICHESVDKCFLGHNWVE